MRTTTFLALGTLGASVASAFTYSVGVGKSEVTGRGGNGEVGFDPSRIVISDQTTDNEIVFEFLGGVHRVVQVSPDQPCAYAGGFDSGIQRVPAGTQQRAGPSATYQVTNNSAVLYFADIGEDYTPCYLGAIFCVGSDETSPTTACHAVIDAAKALGAQYGVTTTSGGASSSTSGTSSAPTSSESSASTTSAASSTSSGASRSSSGSLAAASATPSAGGSNGAGALKVAAGAVALVGGAAALLV